MEPIKILFICSRNQWRSPTAEVVWCKLQGVSVRSAGTSPKARRRVTAGDIRWADVIFAMEDKHRQRLQDRFRDLLRAKQVEVLDIPDAYQYMDPELVAIFRAEAEAFMA